MAAPAAARAAYQSAVQPRDQNFDGVGDQILDDVNSVDDGNLLVPRDGGVAADCQDTKAAKVGRPVDVLKSVSNGNSLRQTRSDLPGGSCPAFCSANEETCP